MNYKYTPLYRPPSFSSVPEGYVLLECPRIGLGFDRRTDLVSSSYRYGVIGYRERLSKDDLERYQLREL